MSQTATICRLLSRIFAIIVLVSQGAILDYYLISGNSNSTTWWTWILTDIIVLSVWIITMVKSQRRLEKNTALKSKEYDGITKDELAYCYLAWIVYSLHLVPQAVVIIKLVAHKLEEKTMFFGPNLLKMDLCLTPVIFLFFVFAHYDARPNTRRKLYLEKLLSMVTLDLFDSVEMLENLFDKEKIPPVIENVILVFAAINFCLPTLALYELKHNKFRDSGEVSPVSFKLLYICIFLLFVNIPFLVIRLVLWHKYSFHISVLLAKNGLGVGLGVLEIVEFIGEQRPKKCSKCSKTFVKEVYKSHHKSCGQDKDRMAGMDNMNDSNGFATDRSRKSTGLESYV